MLKTFFYYLAAGVVVLPVALVIIIYLPILILGHFYPEILTYQWIDKLWEKLQLLQKRKQTQQLQGKIEEIGQNSAEK